MVILIVKLIQLSLVLLLPESLIHVGFLVKGVADINRVLHHLHNRNLAPFFASSCRDLFAVQFPSNVSAAQPTKGHGKNLPHHFCFLCDNHELPFLPLISVGCDRLLVGAIFKALSDAPFHVTGNAVALVFREAGENAEHKLRMHVVGMDLLFFKVDGYAEGSEKSYHFEAVGGVPCESADGLG